MPVTEIPLDSSTQEENVTLLHGRNILIKLIEDRKAQYLLENPQVKEFLSTEDMTCEEFRGIMNETSKIDQDIEKVITGGKSGVDFDIMLHNAVESLEASLAGLKSSKDEEKKATIENVLELSQKNARDLRKRITDEIVIKLVENDGRLLENERELRDTFNPKANLLTTVVISRCPHCGNFMTEAESQINPQQIDSPTNGSISIGSLLKPFFKKPGKIIEVREKTKCNECGNAVTPKDVNNLTIHTLQPFVRIVWNNNLWFEEYISAILRSFGWKTWSHVHVLGSSGIRHEVDTLAVKGGYVLVCECKTGAISRQGVFNFWTKTYDIKSHLSILALVQELPEPETRQFILKNPSVTLLENLGKKRRDQIIAELGNSVMKRI